MLWNFHTNVSCHTYHNLVWFIVSLSMENIFSSARPFTFFLYILGFFPIAPEIDDIYRSRLIWKICGVCFSIINVLIAFYFFWINVRNEEMWTSSSSILTNIWNSLAFLTPIIVLITFSYQMTKLKDLKVFFKTIYEVDNCVRIF